MSVWHSSLPHLDCVSIGLSALNMEARYLNLVVTARSLLGIAQQWFAASTQPIGEKRGVEYCLAMSTRS